MNFEQAPLVWQHRMWGSGSIEPSYNNGVFFYGDKATIFASDRRVVIMPAGRNQEQEVVEVPTEGGMGERHMADFLNAVRAKNKALLSCTVPDAFQSTATVQLAMISYYTGSEVHWDASNATIKSNPEAADLLARAYRSGYQRP
jgi:hypothetical protein